MPNIHKHIDSSYLKLSPIKEIGGQRYYRYLSYKGTQKLIVETPTFHCAGPVDGKYRDIKQLPVPLDALVELLKVDNFVKQNSQLPTNAPDGWRKIVMDNDGDVTAIHRDLNLYDRVYITIEDGAPVFHLVGRERFSESLAAGQYRCLILVRGVYLGMHGGLPKVSSLQVRIIQMLHNPEPATQDVCLFLPEEEGDQDGGSLAVMPNLEEILASITPADMLETGTQPTSSQVSLQRQATTCVATTTPTTASTASTGRQGLARRRKAGLTLDIPEPPSKVRAKDKQIRELMQEYSWIDYPTQDPDPDDFEARLLRKQQIERKLIELCGQEWEANFYADFQRQKQQQQQ